MGNFIQRFIDSHDNGTLILLGICGALFFGVAIVGNWIINRRKSK
jgi:hypothetical protein